MDVQNHIEAMESDQSLSYQRNSSQVNQEKPSFPSLVNIGQSGTWNRRQRRTFQRLKSWTLYLSCKGYQLLRVDLTSSNERGSEFLSADFKKLRRRAEKKFKGYKIHFFKVQTFEGNGVLHLVLAVKWNRPIYIAQAWLSEEWASIHGAHRVWIKRMRSKDRDLTRVSRYFSCQYLAGQCSIARVSWSWWRDGLSIARAWNFYRKEMQCLSDIYTWAGFNPCSITVSKKEFFSGWNKILRDGWCSFGRMIFFISGRDLDLGLD
jgi:hypothetical protein